MPIEPRVKAAPPRSPDALLAVTGPTACGKSELALRLALALGGEIVVIDSAQVYRGLDIGTAKVPPELQRSIPHHLVDVVDPNEEWSVARFCEEADRVIGEIRARGKLPILAGGTTLYLTHLLHGLVAAPKADETELARLAAMSLEELRAELELVDPESARRIHPNDRFRTSRALEVCKSTGRPASEVRAAHGYREARHRAIVLVPERPRDELYRRIDRRSLEMVRAGLVDETRTIVQSFGAEARVLRFLGYAQVVELLGPGCDVPVGFRSGIPGSGEGASPDEAVAAAIALETRRYAKRQLTFWRNEPEKRGWLTVRDTAALRFDSLAEVLADRLSRAIDRTEIWHISADTVLAEDDTENGDR